MSSRAFRRHGAVLLALVLAASAGPAWTQAPAPAQSPAQASAPPEVRIDDAQRKALGIETAAPVPAQAGDVQGLPARVVIPNHQLRMVSAPLAAMVEQILVATEQQVRKGQRLVRMLSPGLADLQHTYLQAVTHYELARDSLLRDEKLIEAGVIPESRMVATRSRMNEVSADLAERLQALRLAGMSDAAIEQLRQGRAVGSVIELTAPMDGVVVEQLATVGQRVEAAAPLIKLARLDPLWLEIQVPVARLSGLERGAPVRVPGADASGTVLAVGRSVAAESQTALVRAEITRGAARLRPGQLVEASLQTSPEGGQWRVPNAALARQGGRVFVFVRTGTGFRAQPVRIVGEGAESSLIATPLGAADRIAVRGVASLKSALLGIGVE